jgi:phage gpG-like protein
MRPLALAVASKVDASEPLEEARRVRRSLADLRPVWREAGTVMRRSFAENFREGGRPARWRALSPNTVFQKNLVGYEQGFPYATRRGRRTIRRLEQRGRRDLGNILIARGDLRDSWVQKNANHVSRVSHEGFEEGSKHPLAPIHEEGTHPYVIRPRRGTRLRFATMTGVRYARVVNHPGLPARPVGIVQPEDEERILDLMEAHLG